MTELIEYAQVLLGAIGGVFMAFGVVRVLRAFRRGRHESVPANRLTLIRSPKRTLTSEVPAARFFRLSRATEQGTSQTPGT